MREKLYAFTSPHTQKKRKRWSKKIIKKNCNTSLYFSCLLVEFRSSSKSRAQHKKQFATHLTIFQNCFRIFGTFFFSHSIFYKIFFFFFKPAHTQPNTCMKKKKNIFDEWCAFSSTISWTHMFRVSMFYTYIMRKNLLDLKMTTNDFTCFKNERRGRRRRKKRPKWLIMWLFDQIFFEFSFKWAKKTTSPKSSIISSFFLFLKKKKEEKKWNNRKEKRRGKTTQKSLFHLILLSLHYTCFGWYFTLNTCSRWQESLDKSDYHARNNLYTHRLSEWMCLWINVEICALTSFSSDMHRIASFLTMPRMRRRKCKYRLTCYDLFTFWLIHVHDLQCLPSRFMWFFIQKTKFPSFLPFLFDLREEKLSIFR